MSYTRYRQINPLVENITHLPPNSKIEYEFVLPSITGDEEYLKKVLTKYGLTIDTRLIEAGDPPVIRSASKTEDIKASQELYKKADEFLVKASRALNSIHLNGEQPHAYIVCPTGDGIRFREWVCLSVALVATFIREDSFDKLYVDEKMEKFKTFYTSNSHWYCDRLESFPENIWELGVSLPTSYRYGNDSVIYETMKKELAILLKRLVDVKSIKYVIQL
jgi:hypothetical protein